MSIEFYNQNAQLFFTTTKEVDTSSLIEHFTPYLPQGGTILDAGCGSGRDAKNFIDLGYQVTAFDASEALASLASQLLQIPVTVSTFTNFYSDKPFDGIWACASLLHVRELDLPSTFSHLASQLKPSAPLYCSFKYGTDEVERDGRRFTNGNEQRLSEWITHTQLKIEKIWRTHDLRAERQHELWLNAILIKSE
ncbi:class I SAM-dependent methyltransferase [Vibrio aestuarianus]|uniref:class I SAM-dependent methyltransferase n=1 Tax=Vibrio aestuarianus TaxID=28171 RepID=UPI0014450F3B|nr:class I SAM-dependent methyltransferase [Vibrio aestuarianus]MDE1213321.1 methyltransferase domain-containing protein [Vibrio aestuarianus]MDE1217585.1 methyltransferase domain-containing protein [Vibrio aestuarianus]MDE1260500.1 methyltransferase domain-containing protein [Vibrio aestuarianus]MDE1267238.1 methyltransferase domain-containing protein [Vibrio aestuarianus]MDE1274684.1 methyltransferase domain-containing protein [Vibrio aestuarianus]